MHISKLILVGVALSCAIGSVLILIWLFRVERRRRATDARSQSTEEAFRAVLSNMAPLKGDPRSGPAWVAPVRWGRQSTIGLDMSSHLERLGLLWQARLVCGVLRSRRRTDRIGGMSCGDAGPRPKWLCFMAFTKMMVPIECANCRAQYRAVLANREPRWDQNCLECDSPFGSLHGKYVRRLSPISANASNLKNGHSGQKLHSEGLRRPLAILAMVVRLQRLASIAIAASF
jgi:hypothetical protein